MLTFKIISGGQTGVDRAALDFCLQHNISCGGWCPEGRRAEDGLIPERYPLVESESRDYKARTRLNVEHSDGTLVIYHGQPDEGTGYTIQQVKRSGKPLMVIDLAKSNDPALVMPWMKENKIEVLNVAGPRESKSNGIYHQTFKWLEKAFRIPT